MKTSALKSISRVGVRLPEVSAGPIPVSSACLRYFVRVVFASTVSEAAAISTPLGTVTFASVIVLFVASDEPPPSAISTPSASASVSIFSWMALIVTAFKASIFALAPTFTWLLSLTVNVASRLEPPTAA